MKFLVYFACLALVVADFPAYQTHHEGRRNHMNYNYDYNPSLTHHQQQNYYNHKEQQYSMHGQHHHQQYPQYEEMQKPESYPTSMLPHYPGGQNQGQHQQYMHGEQYNHHQQQYQYGQKHNHRGMMPIHQYKHGQ